MGRSADNERKLEGGFFRLVRGKDAEIERIMLDVLDVALEDLIEAHWGKLAHPEETDTLGWALVHDGKVVKAVSQDGGQVTDASALRTLSSLVSSGPTSGWYGIVCSDMTNDWYRVDWEIIFLHRSARELKKNMYKYLHRI